MPVDFHTMQASPPLGIHRLPKPQPNAIAMLTRIICTIQQLRCQRESHLLVLAVGDALSGSSLRRIWSFVHIEPVNPKNHFRICRQVSIEPASSNSNKLPHGMVDYPDFLGSANPRITHHKPQRLQHSRQSMPTISNIKLPTENRPHLHKLNSLRPPRSCPL